MFGINGSELLILIVLALLVIGPEKLPELAQQLARVTREVKQIAVGAREKVQEELGEEYEELANFDPRQYDPRRIVREALADEPRRPSAGAAARRAARTSATESGTATGAAVDSGSAAGATGGASAGRAARTAGAAAGGTAASAASRPARNSKGSPAASNRTAPARPRHGEAGYVVPFDAEAT